MAGPEDQARRGDGPQEVVEIGLGGARALRAGLGAEVLDDDFLDVPVTAMQVADGEERLEPLGARLADADQDAGGERNTCSSPASRSVSRRASGRLSGEP